MARPIKNIDAFERAIRKVVPKDTYFSVGISKSVYSSRELVDYDYRVYVGHMKVKGADESGWATTNLTAEEAIQITKETFKDHV